MSSDRYRGQSRQDNSRGRFDDRHPGDAGRDRSNAGQGNSPSDRQGEYRHPYEPDAWDMAPRGEFRSQDRPYAEFQADGDPSSSRSGRSEGATGQGRGTWSPGSRPEQSPQGDMRGGSFDGYDRGEPARQRATGGGYGEYNYREEDSPRGGPMGGHDQSGFGQGRMGQRAEPSWRPGESSRGQFSGKGPKGYLRSDERVREDVSDALERNGDLDASEIEVVVVAGEVTLQGEVTDRYGKRLAEDLIEDLPGVKQVHNRLRVGDGSNRKENGPRQASGKSATRADRSTSGSGRSSS